MKDYLENALKKIKRIRCPRASLPVILEIENNGKIYESPIIDSLKKPEPKVRLGSMDELKKSLKAIARKFRIGRKR